MQPNIYYEGHWHDLPSKIYTGHGWSTNIRNIIHSPTPPPPGTHYAWEGGPHASPSVKRVGGEVEVRNIVPNPRGANTGSEIVVVENFEGSVSPDPDLDLVGGNLVGLQPIGASISGGGGSVYWSESRNSYALYANGTGHASIRMGISYSGSMAVRVDVFETTAVGTRPARARYDYEQSGWEDYAFPTVIQNAETGGGSTFYFQVNDPDEGDVYYFTLQIVEAGTEQDALAQVEHYFDGDTVSDRAYDLWYNAEGVPHEWVNGQGWVEL